MKHRPAISMEEFLNSLKAFPTREMALAEARNTIDAYHSENPGMPPVFVALLSDVLGFRAILNPGDVHSRRQVQLFATVFDWAVEFVPEADVPGGKAAGS